VNVFEYVVIFTAKDDSDAAPSIWKTGYVIADSADEARVKIGMLIGESLARLEPQQPFTQVVLVRQFK
jgi:hypothetical protein